MLRIQLIFYIDDIFRVKVKVTAMASGDKMRTHFSWQCQTFMVVNILIQPDYQRCTSAPCVSVVVVISCLYVVP